MEDDIEQWRIARDIAEEEGNDEARAVAVEQLRKAQSVAFTEMAAMRRDVAIAKAPIVAAYVKDMLEDGDNKVIVFAHHIAVIDLLMTELGEYNPVKITGECSQQARQSAVDAFQADPKCRVFVGNIKAAGVGLTLTAASTVVFAELDWTPAGMSQAEDRAHRIGQKDNVLVYHLVFDGSLDATISKRLVAKQAIIDRALDNPTGAKPIVEAVTTIEVNEAEETEAAPDAIPDETVELIHHGLRFLAGRDSDHARFENGIGFNGRDTAFGHKLADLPVLTQRQAAIGLKMCRFYRRQLAAIMTWGEDGKPCGM
jgi:Helicase conserved C-terminal domain